MTVGVVAGTLFWGVIAGLLIHFFGVWAVALIPVISLVFLAWFVVIADENPLVLLGIREAK